MFEIITTGGSLYRRACVLVVAGPGRELAGWMTVVLSKEIHHMTPSYF
jgi:hypothetical protein